MPLLSASTPKTRLSADILAPMAPSMVSSSMETCTSPPLDCPGFLNTVVNGIDDNFQHIVGSCNDGVTTTAAIYDGATLTLFQCGDAADTAATAINNDGVVVGWYDTPDTTHGFITFDMGKNCTTIDYPDAPNTQVNGISPSGTLVGFYFDDELSYVRSFVATPKQL